MFSPKGKDLINSVAQVFTKIQEDLKRGIEQCNADKTMHQDIIKDSQQEIAVIDSHVEKANKILNGINKLTESAG